MSVFGPGPACTKMFNNRGSGEGDSNENPPPPRLSPPQSSSPNVIHTSSTRVAPA